MNNQNIKLALRGLLKNKVVSFLNLIGLTVGITVYMLTFLFVLKENNVDKYIPHLDHIYVLTNQNDVAFSQGMVNHVKTGVPELNAVTYCCYDWSPQIFLKRDDESYKVRKMLTADSCFFRVFNFKPLWGNPEDALTATNKIVITRSLSEKIFGKENPVGKTVTYNATYLQGEELEVTAVIDNLPQSSSWDFEAILSFQTNYHIGWYVNNLKRWGTHSYQAFTKINATVPGEVVNNKLADISLDAVPDGYKDDTRYGIFPFKKAYFDLPGLDVIKHGNRFTLSIIGIVGILILLLSCVNYINMVTAQREKRYKNIGIFKTMGSDRNRIFQMTTTESALMLLTAIVFSFFTTLFLLPGFNLLTGSKFSIDQLFTADFLTMLVLAFGMMIFFTGIVPGYIFGNKPVTLLIRKDQSSGGKNLVRNSLLVFQFTVSIALIASILMINRQNSYVKKRDTGFTRENIVYANTNDILDDHIDAFKSEVKKITGINEFTFSESVLIKNNENWGIDMVNKGEKYNINFSKMSVAPNFFDFFGIKLKEGNTFNGYSNKKKDFIFNQAAKDEFGIENIENARVAISSDPQQGCIIGIVDDYNFESFHVPVRPAAFMSSGDCDEVMYLKISTGNLASFHAIMKEVEKLWSRFSPDFPLEYQFLDQTYAAMYTKEAQFQKFLLYTTLISLVLSCLGLIGLTFFVMERRTKEIGIRKVNGAKVSEILAMLNEDFVKWVAIAFVIATPVAYYVMNQWLETFAYKTSLSWWIFALAGLLALGIALLTVSWQSWKAATRNPVEALRYE